MPRVLLIAWLFPPHASVGAKRPWRLAKHLPALGWDVTVLTQARVPSRLRDDATPDTLGDSVRVVRAYDPAPLARLAAELDERGASGGPATVVDSEAAPSFAARWLPTEPALVYVPHAISQAIALLRERSHDAIVTTSYPFSSHLVGAAVARATGLPWIADLRDPWTLHWSHERKSAPARAVERALERETFARASAVTVTTETLRDAYRARYPRANVLAIRNAFDPVPLPPLAPTRGPARLVHFGHVYGGARSLAPVLEGLARVVRARGLTARDVVLENYGRFAAEDLALATRLGVDAMLSLHAPRPYAEGLASLRGASLLLLPTWATHFGALFLPAKLYDYLLVGAPILAVGDNPELAAILEDTRAGTLVRESDIASIAATIERAIDGETAPASNPTALERFTARGMSASFAAALDQCLLSERPWKR